MSHETRVRALLGLVLGFLMGVVVELAYIADRMDDLVEVLR